MSKLPVIPLCQFFPKTGVVLSNSYLPAASSAAAPLRSVVCPRAFTRRTLPSAALTGARVHLRGLVPARTTVYREMSATEEPELVAPGMRCEPTRGLPKGNMHFGSCFEQRREGSQGGHQQAVPGHPELLNAAPGCEGIVSASLGAMGTFRFRRAFLQATASQRFLLRQPQRLGPGL